MKTFRTITISVDAGDWGFKQDLLLSTDPSTEEAYRVVFEDFADAMVDRLFSRVFPDSGAEDATFTARARAFFDEGEQP